MDWDRDKERKAGKAMTIGGSIYAIVFMVIWCALAAASGAWFMLIFGLPMLGFVIFRLAFMLKKSKQKPVDPWEQAEHPRQADGYTTFTQNTRDGFCPYCGEEVKAGFAFCPKCGRKLQ